MKRFDAVRVTKLPLGWQIAALAVAGGMNEGKGVPVYACPDEGTYTDKSSFDAMVDAIAKSLRALYPMVVSPTYGERFRVREHTWDVAGTIQAGNFHDWRLFFRGCGRPLNRPVTDLPDFPGVPKGSCGWASDKLVSDGLSGETAADQSTGAGYSWLPELGKKIVLLQHFKAGTDEPTIRATCEATGCDVYIPGQTEHPEVYGIRGVPHAAYYNLYQKLGMLVTIPGTQLWLALYWRGKGCKYVLPYDKNLPENWAEAIAVGQELGFDISGVGFDKTSDMAEVYAKTRKLALAA